MIDIYKAMKCVGRLYISQMPTSFMTENYGRMRPYTPVETILIRHYAMIVHTSEVFGNDR